MATTSDIEAKLRRNSHVKKFLHAFQHKEDLQLDLDAIETELINLHAARPIRVLNAKEATESKVINANFADQRARSRAAELYITVNHVWNELDSQLQLTKEVLYLKFPSVFSQYRHRTDKERLLNVLVFSDVSIRMQRLKSIMDLISTILDDIDQGHFTLQRHVTILVNSSQRKNIERSLTR